MDFNYNNNKDNVNHNKRSYIHLINTSNDIKLNFKSCNKENNNNIASITSNTIYRNLELGEVVDNEFNEFNTEENEQFIKDNNITVNESYNENIGEYIEKRQKIDYNDNHIKTSILKGEAPDFKSFNKTITTITTQFGDTTETDPHRIETRMKQILFGKNTTGYDNYISAIPKDKRKSLRDHPRTPDPHEKISKRSFDGLVKAWRRRLHEWDNIDVIASTITGESINRNELDSSITNQITSTDSIIMNDNALDYDDDIL